MQKFELSEEMLETITGGINKNTLKKISAAAGAVAAVSAMAVIGKTIYTSNKKKKKKKKQEHTLEIRETKPIKIYPIEEFSCN